jgi:hypothetical protein
MFTSDRDYHLQNSSVVSSAGSISYMKPAMKTSQVARFRTSVTSIPKRTRLRPLLERYRNSRAALKLLGPEERSCYALESTHESIKPAAESPILLGRSLGGSQRSSVRGVESITHIASQQAEGSNRSLESDMISSHSRFFRLSSSVILRIFLIAWSCSEGGSCIRKRWKAMELKKMYELAGLGSLIMNTRRIVPSRAKEWYNSDQDAIVQTGSSTAMLFEADISAMIR